MKQTIEIPVGLYQRLGSHAVGFEDPSRVIERILDAYEDYRGIKSLVSLKTVTEMPTSLEIVYYPSNEENFKRLLLQIKVAYLLLHKLDGSKEIKEWNAINFSESSSVNSNLRSGYLRDWRKKGIVKAEISTDRSVF